MTDRRIQAVLAFLFAFDLLLTAWAFACPQLWFTVFHGAPSDDAQGLLRRCGANWAAFALLQGLALWRWRRDAAWLAVVAGLRLGDMFTDVTTVLCAQHTTTFARLVLPFTSLANALLGLFLWRAHRARQGPLTDRGRQA